MSRFEVVLFRPEFREAVVHLRRHSYENEFPEAHEYLEWKYIQNPWIHEHLLYVSLDENGTVCGMRGAYGTAWRTPHGTVVIPCADDLTIVNEHRNSGLLTTLLRAMLDDITRRGYPFLINTSAGRVTTLQSLAMGWKSVGAMEPVAFRGWRARLRNESRTHLRGRRLVWRLAPRDEGQRPSDPRPFERLDRAGGATTRGGLFITVEKEPRVQAMADLAARSPHDGRIRHVRDTDFFGWRFRNPSREHRFLFAEREGRLEGWMALSRRVLNAAPFIPYHFVDWETGEAAILAELLRCALAWGRFDELGAWSGTMCAEDRALLESAGFRPDAPHLRARGLPCVLLKKLGPDGNWTLGGLPAPDPKQWDIRMVDSMRG